MLVCYDDTAVFKVQSAISGTREARLFPCGDARVGWVMGN